MPRLSKIRIAGPKYAGFSKRHENTIFDLSPAKEGDHTLFTLPNGSGKGVMLQLIFQIIMPGTSWGKNNGNKLEGMFYDRYNVLKKYTFHVGLEWNLDGPDKRKLMAAICVSAHWNKNLDESEGKVGLKYFLYTHEYKGDSRFSLENLPLYSKSTAGPLVYEGMEEYIDDNKEYFRKYSKTAVQSLNSDYYQYLASHGIYRSEWGIMKSINRTEGGLERYFSRAKDNQALFDKLIIPAVSESIASRSGENENSLLSMFVDNIKIAKNLPELISRTEDINQLLQMVLPLLTDAEHGLKLEKTSMMIRERGNNYFHALQTRRSFLENELRRSKEEHQKTLEQIEELKYQKANLKYAKKLKELKELEKMREDFEKEIEIYQSGLKQLKEEEKELQLKQIYLLYQKYQKEFKQNKARIEYLQETADLSDLREEIKKSKEAMIKAWPNLKEKLEESSQDISAYRNYLNSAEKSIKQERENINTNIRDRERHLDRYKQREKSFEQWRNELAERFNPLQLSSPSYLLEDITTNIEKNEKKIQKYQQKKSKLQENIENIEQEIYKSKLSLATEKPKYQEAEKDLKTRKNEEEEMRLELVKLLQLDKFKEVYNQDWLNEKRIALKALSEEKNQKLQDLKNKSHELELDLALNDQEYWIANNDQQRLYKMISELDVKVYYGSDFLINMEENQEDLVEKYPLLPYGLVLIYEADWLKVSKNIPMNELFRSPVPIFINHKLESIVGEDSFKLLKGQGEEFIKLPDKYQQWSEGLFSQQAEIKATIATLEKKIENIRRLDYTAEILLGKTTSHQLSDELAQLKDTIAKLEKEIEFAQKKFDQLKEELSTLNKKIESSEDRKNQLEKDQREIKKFAEESNYLEEKKTEIAEIEKEVKGLEKNLTENHKNLDQNRQLQLKIENQKEYWLKDLRRFTAEIKEIIPDLKFEEKIVEKELQNYPQLFDYRESKLNYYYQKLLDLEREEEARSTEIKYLREKQDDLRELIINKEEELEALDSDWQEYSLTGASKEELRVALKKLKSQLEEQSKKLKKLEEEKFTLNGQIESAKNQIDELYKEISDRFHKTARSWSDLDLNKKELDIEKSIKADNKYLRELEDMLEEYKDKINILDNLINKLELYELDADKGEINSRLEEQIRDNPSELVEKWVKDYQNITKKLRELKRKTEDDFYSFKRKVNESIKNKILKVKITENIIQDFRSEHYDFNYEMLASFREYLHNELNRLDENKAEAEQARNQWAERSAMHVLRIITSMKEMINNMVYHNKKGYAFPLIRMRRNDFLPELEDEIIPELKEYFLELIDKFNSKDVNIERLSESELKKYTGDAALFSRAVRGRYPVLQVYKMTEKNEFRYAKPQDYFYADWEAVIQGKGDISEGSGGQSLSINAFMMMMLLNYKKQGLDKSNPWTVLFLDNPFGAASAAHVLDPVFEIANKLNFQLIAFAAPEIIKTEISERFPVFYPLEIADDEKGRGIVNISGQVLYGERIRRRE